MQALSRGTAKCVGHFERCRSRVEEELGKLRLSQATDRLIAANAENLEEADRKRKVASDSADVKRVRFERDGVTHMEVEPQLANGSDVPGLATSVIGGE